MTRLVTSGYELGLANGLNSALSPDGSSPNSVLDSTIFRSGSNSMKCSGVGVNIQSSTWTPTAPALGTDVFLRSYIYVPTGKLPADATKFAEVIGVGSPNIYFKLRLLNDGTLVLYAKIGLAAWTQQGSPSTPIALDSWQMVELRGRIDIGSTDQCEGRLNETTFASASGLNVSDTAIGQVEVGSDMDLLSAADANVVVYHDDTACNDSTGASQNSWPGQGKIVLLKPVTDNAGGTGWTLGTGTALGGAGHTAVANTPPLGVADLTAGSDVKQIRNATSNANVNYDANMTTYAAAELSQYDVVTVVDPIIATAAPVTTSSKQGTVGIVSNPTIANIALGAGGTAGAFWSGAAAGTYLTGWKWSHGTVTYNPSVTISTAPVMRVTQVTASTRIAMVCFMGMYVEYVPHTRPSPIVRSDAQHRASNW